MDILKWKWTVRFSCGNVTNRNAQSANFHPYILSNYLFRVTSIWYSECLLFILVSKIRHYLILNHISLSLNSNPEASPEISESSQTETVLVLEVRLVTTEGEGEMALIGCPLEPGTRTWRNHFDMHIWYSYYETHSNKLKAKNYLVLFDTFKNLS